MFIYDLNYYPYSIHETSTSSTIFFGKIGYFTVYNTHSTQAIHIVKTLQIGFVRFWLAITIQIEIKPKSLIYLRIAKENGHVAVVEVRMEKRRGEELTFAGTASAKRTKCN